LSVHDLLMNRRSIRVFEDRPVDEDVLGKLLDAAANAPSGGNIQPLSVIVVRDAGRRAKLAEVVGGQPWVANAPVDLVFCLDFHAVQRWAETEGVTFRGRESLSSFLIAYADVMCAAQSVVVLAEDLGLGSVYVGTIQVQLKDARRLLELPGGVLPVMLLAVGYPASRPKNIPKLSAGDIRHDERYRVRSDEEVAEMFRGKYGVIGDDLDAYFERAYVEVVEADRQQEESWTAEARARMERLNIRNNAQFLFELRYPQDVMVGFNRELVRDLEEAGFRFLREQEEGGDVGRGGTEGGD